jgi:hypothetical protein
MSVKMYKCTSTKIHGAMYLRFENEELTHIELAWSRSLKQAEFAWLRDRLPQHEHELSLLSEHMNVQELTPRSVREKVILFNNFYKHYRGVSYQVKTQEKANVKTVPVTREFLTTFFESPLQNFTLENYIKRINIIKDQAQNGRDTVKYPNKYDPQFERTLNSEQTQAYHKHLQSIGWRRKYAPQRGTYWEEVAINQTK